jgi:hypothetical protein
MADKKTEKFNNLQEEFNKIQEENKHLDIGMHLATLGDLPDLGEIQIYNYDNDIIESGERADDVVISLVDLYLGDAPSVKDHNYIQNKMKEDANVYADALFLTKMTKKTFINQMRQVDNGDNNARMYEVMNQTMGQYRENIKFSQNQRTELEKFYKEMRKDLGLNEMESKVEITQESEEDGKEQSMVMDSRKMNDIISQYLKNK